MTSSNVLRWVLPLLCCAAFASHAAGQTSSGQEPKTAAKQEADKAKSAPKAAAKEIAWLSDLATAHRQSLADRKPIFILVGAKWCGFCRKMMMEVNVTAVEAELARWTPVYLDADAQSNDVNPLGVVGVPAMRILAPGGQPTAQRDGYLAPDDLVTWLKDNYEAATAAADETLLAAGPPSAMAVVRLVKQFRQRSPALREAAVRRLTPYPDVARPLVLKTFCEGSLTARLAALEVLEQWKAPLSGVDPWRPETFTPERLARLEKWGESDALKISAAPKELTAEQLADARRQIDRMLAADETEADAIRHRLAGLGAGLLPEVYARLKNAAADQERRRLLILRYRLSASDSLVLRWPGGLERLGDTDPRQRRQAADELAKLAGDDEKNLLLELFADTDPLVREIGLRGLQHIGGKEANAALVRLLDDPEPNVRAAVLKQLEESPDPAMTSAVVKYLSREKDPDLIVHGICFLKAAKGKEALKCLMSLLKHESWQVRAEAAVGIGKQNGNRYEQYVSFSSSRRSSSGEPDEATKLKVEAYVALLDLLGDKDAFVVAKAVEGLAEADMAVAVEPLVHAAEKHPDLAASVLTMLAGGSKMRAKAIPHMRKFCKHEQARIRAAAVAALASASPLTADEELLAAVNDKESEVRIAAAKAGFGLLNQARRSAKDNASSASGVRVLAIRVESLGPSVTETVMGSVAEAYSKLMTLSGPATKSAVPVPSTGKASSEDSKPVVKSKPAEPKPAELSDKKTVAKPKLVESSNKKKPVESKPAKAEPDANEADRWLVECYAGKHRPKWSSQMVAPLEKMLRADAANERIAAALLLMPLGKADEAVPVLLETVRKNPELTRTVADALPWLCIEPRIKMFRDLRAIAPNAEARAGLVQEFSQEPDRRLADPMWELLADPKVTIEEARSLQMGLVMAYFGQRYYSSSDVLPSDRRALAKAAKPRTMSGGDIQRRVALMLLATAAADEAAETAKALADDPKLGKSLRTDAFQIRLITQSNAEAKKLALAAMKGTDAARKKLAVKYLVHGPSELISFADGIYLNGMSFTSSSSVQSGTPIVPEAPTGVTAADLRPLLGGSDSETAASVAYLLAVLGESEGIEPLVEYWRRHGTDSSQWRRLVYRAIAVIDDPKYIAVLREIYGKLSEYEVSEFYWTIRIMSGPEILKFRKQIRDEKGEQLR